VFGRISAVFLPKTGSLTRSNRANRLTITWQADHEAVSTAPCFEHKIHVLGFSGGNGDDLFHGP